MSAVAHKLTLEEFRAAFADCKPNYELLDGDAFQKAMPTKLHSFLQLVLCVLLKELGFKAGPELTLAIDENWEPVPDVCGLLASLAGEPYPTRPVAVAVEILSPGDPFTRIIRKCRRYAQWGIADILVFDPIGREAWFWDTATDNLASLKETCTFRSKPVQFTLTDVFARLDAEL